MTVKLALTTHQSDLSAGNVIFIGVQLSTGGQVSVDQGSHAFKLASGIVQQLLLPSQRLAVAVEANLLGLHLRVQSRHLRLRPRHHRVDILVSQRHQQVTLGHVFALAHRALGDMPIQGGHQLDPVGRDHFPIQRQSGRVAPQRKRHCRYWPFPLCNRHRRAASAGSP